MESIAKLPIIGKQITISDSELIDIVLIARILASNTYSYGYRRGKYGTITDFRTSIRYRIPRELAEKMFKLFE